MSTIKIETHAAVFYLPYFVARDKGYFADEGLDVELVPKPAPPEDGLELIEEPAAQDSFHTFTLFESGTTQLYNACEWGQLRRSQDSNRGGRVVARRAAVASQAIVVRGDSPHNVPTDLAGVPVGVNFHHGSHYLVLQTLEGFLPRTDIKLLGVKGKSRLDALADGDIEAVALMEPWISVAEKRGYKVLAEAHYFGAEVADDAISPDDFDRINRAVSRAVDTIHDDIRPFLHYFIEQAAGVEDLRPEDLRPSRLRYIHPGPYPEEDYHRILDWIASWGLIRADAEYEKLVDSSKFVDLR
ncbi:ABC transporter substrate-binding protein [Georgenia sp. Z1491]|uniref:ABC transporter substrate-binding protein n=1 Tax=Georgenia sp. Z1491 TaxID=3416707 RepID=UPI003CE70AE7